MKVCAVQYGVDPCFALAVAAVESRPARFEHVLQIRCGPLGRKQEVFGPMGINRAFLDKWNIADPLVNIQVGVRALQGKNRRQVLRRYNKGCSEAYVQAVETAYRVAKRERIFR